MTTLPVAGARAGLSRLVEQASTTHERFEITRNGQRAAVLLGADDYDSLLETVAILSDSELIKSIHEGIHDLEEGHLSSLDEVRDEMRSAGRIR